MIIWVDAQLPPSLARWIRHIWSYDCVRVQALGLRDSSDEAITRAAAEAGTIVLTKDGDFSRYL